ncbi:MAG: hypothetical protein ACI88H_001986 [Cocleimonas sp.]|jgi:hypothetical protein
MSQRDAPLYLSPKIKCGSKATNDLPNPALKSRVI